MIEEKRIRSKNAQKVRDEVDRLIKEGWKLVWGIGIRNQKFLAIMEK